jgi:two-component system, NarL family, nitrate/nitrite response regulator NarL
VESRTPFQVCGEAEHGIDAIEKAKELQPDLILLDLSMPIMTGAEAAVILKRAYENNSLLDAHGRCFYVAGESHRR